MHFFLSCLCLKYRKGEPAVLGQAGETFSSTKNLKQRRLVGLMERRFKRDWYLPLVPRAPSWVQTRSGLTKGPDPSGVTPYLFADNTYHLKRVVCTSWPPSTLFPGSPSTSWSRCTQRESRATRPSRRCSSGSGTPCRWCTRGQQFESTSKFK